MAKPYVLSNSLTSKQKIDKILKRIHDNAAVDRAEAGILYGKVKEALNELGDAVHQTEFGPNVDAFSKIIQTAAITLNQMGRANEQLLKLVAILQRNGETKGKSADVGGSLFAALSKLETKDKKAPLDDEDD